MVKNGIKLNYSANVKMDISGIVWYVRRILYVQVIWFGIKSTNSVSVRLVIIGVGISVSLSPSASQPNILISLPSSVYVPPTVSGMAVTVSTVSKAKYGIILVLVVNAP